MQNDVTLEAARRARDRVLADLGGRADVVGVGIAPDPAHRFAIKVNLSAPLPPGESLPDEVEGVPVRVAVVGPVKALAA